VLLCLPARRGDVDEPQAAIHFLRGVAAVDRVRMEARGAGSERDQHNDNTGDQSHAIDEASPMPAIFPKETP
jgi:hypothetical protein